MKSERVGFMTEKKYTAVVVDDEPVCIHNLRQSLSDYPEVMLKGEASTVKEGMRLILREKPNLLFLDVELPGMSGVELIQELRHRISWSMLVVFLYFAPRILARCTPTVGFRLFAQTLHHRRVCNDYESFF